MEKKQSVELVTSEVEQIRTRGRILSKLGAEIQEKQFLYNVVSGDISTYMKKLVKKYGLDESKEYVFENGTLKVDDSPAEPVKATPEE